MLNLVPGLPLDGGRVLRAAVWKATGNPHQGTDRGRLGRPGRRRCWRSPTRSCGSSSLGARPATLTDYVFAFVIASFLWSGASAVDRLRPGTPPAARAAGPRLARRTLAVPHDLPLAEAVRRAQEEQAGSIVVLDATGRPSAIVNEAAVLATPEDRRPWLPVSAVARSPRARAVVLRPTSPASR